jgi:hypothetical protein
MYMLNKFETSLVSGGSGTGETVPGLEGGGGETRTKNNNGYGNGAESGPAPGNSGSHNPQLWTQNSGPRGVR